ncbi:MAG: hypothetical protein JSV64_07285 [Candidatus Bathyarchaeota archaeon]|nr:MAG: hypothetical protein JSV64_07285 [Candidatus Bathyarchaeota archaeon]
MLDTNEIMKIALELVGFESPPADSTINVKGTNIRKILFGIDADVPELMYAKQSGYDAVISHHPKGGSAILDFHKVFRRHIQQMVDAGIPQDEAEQAIDMKLSALKVESHLRNYNHSVDVARLLRMPYMNIHTPLDELGRRIMDQTIEQNIKEDAHVANVVQTLKQLPEFANAQTDVEIRLGDETHLAGKTVVSHGAGTNGGFEVAKTYFKYGVNTLIYIHIGPEDLRKLKTYGKGNLVVTGHIASDSVGINPFIKELEDRGVSVTRIGIVHSGR